MSVHIPESPEVIDTHVGNLVRISQRVFSEEQEISELADTVGDVTEDTDRAWLLCNAVARRIRKQHTDNGNEGPVEVTIDTRLPYNYVMNLTQALTFCELFRHVSEDPSHECLDTFWSDHVIPQDDADVILFHLLQILWLISLEDSDEG